MRTKFSGILTLFMAFVVQFTFAQEKTITGTVTDAESGMPLAGVSIIIEGTSTGTQTDFDGNYSLEASPGQTLMFTYVGYADQSVSVGASATIDVSMSVQAAALDQVVVTALGVERAERSLGYSTQQVDGSELSNSGTSNALKALSGKVAGVSITAPSGNLGGSTRILLRGPGSITQENKPLVIVDGVPLDNSNYNTTATQTGGGGVDYGGGLGAVNPDDIASMNVLKGGAAAALYGSRASNGVILITTKSGKAGKAQVIVNTGVTFESVSIIPQIQKLYGGGAGNPNVFGSSTFETEVLNGESYKVVDYATDESWGPRYEGQMVLHWDNVDPTLPELYLNPRPWVYPENDLYDFFRTGISYNNGVAFTQGTEKSQFRLSLNNTETKGIIPNSNISNTTVNFNAKSEITEKLQIDAGVNMSITDGFNRPTFGYGDNSLIQKFFIFGQTQLDYERLKNYKRPDGSQRPWNRLSATNGNPRFSDNPYWTIYENTNEDKRVRFFGNIGLQYDLTDEIYVTGKMYGDMYNFKIRSRVAVGSQATSDYTEIDRNFQELNYQVRLHYDDAYFDEKLTLNTFVGTNRRDVETHFLSGTTRGGLATAGIYNLNNSIDDPLANDADTRKRVNSLFGSATIGYDNFLFATVTGRNDWSSTLPAENNSYFYPSVSGSFVFSELLDASWLSFGKLRGGFAKVGSDTDPYRLINTYFSRGSFFGGIGFSNAEDANTSVKLNSELKPEFQDTWEVGLELAFFENRFRVDFTYYDEVTSDLITPVAVDPATGYTSTFLNAGKMSNEGIELLVGITPIRTDDLRWDLSWNFAKNDNTLLELVPGVTTLQIATLPFKGVTTNAVVGESYGVIRGSNYVYDDQGNRVVGPNGLYLATRNVENLGSVLPDYNMSFRSDLSYKGFTFGVLVDVQEGGVYRSMTNMWGHYSGMLEETAGNGIREDGLVLQGVTGTVTYDDEGNYTVTDTAPNTTRVTAQAWGQSFYTGNVAQNVFDASYVKLREVSLGYTFPDKWTGPMDAITLTAFGRNLAAWGLDNENIDPEMASGGSGNIQGSEGGSLPSTRSIGFNVELRF